MRPNRGVITKGLAGGGDVGVEGMGGSLSPTCRQTRLVGRGFTSNLRNTERRVCMGAS